MESLKCSDSIVKGLLFGNYNLIKIYQCISQHDMSTSVINEDH